MIHEDAIEFLDETWRPPAGSGRAKKAAKTLPSLIGLAALTRGKGVPRGIKAKLARITARAPEVMVKVSGRQRGGTHTLAHLDYVSRHGKLEVETGDGERLSSSAELAALAAEWVDHEDRTTRRREPLTSVSLVLSMPPGHDAERVWESVRAFARVELEAFPYVMALHTDTDHPHVHVTVAARGEGGRRFNPRKEDLARWRETFARELRARGIAAEATPRRARGVVQRHDKIAVRKIGERAATKPRVRQSAARNAAKLATENPPKPKAWETRAVARQAKIRAAYKRAADLLEMGDAQERTLAKQTRQFVAEMPSPATRDRAEAIQIAKERRRLSRDRKPKERKRS
ncbi:hypothetical protein FHS31_002969 [Sphingomonas vulcanisoli]|uniref:MobA/VirD2-like nuclease domain-containing protein n=1 Tax=Sphingomonas vulcanisoli TaxID=1658060 RepID=A0ABX0TUY3_9SPHN|nr:hypothetical protein [Sphingomonas vulcanisoli]